MFSLKLVKQEFPDFVEQHALHDLNNEVGKSTMVLCFVSHFFQECHENAVLLLQNRMVNGLIFLGTFPQDLFWDACL